jgi:hypothetical protein
VEIQVRQQGAYAPPCGVPPSGVQSFISSITC